MLIKRNLPAGTGSLCRDAWRAVAVVLAHLSCVDGFAVCSPYIHLPRRYVSHRARVNVPCATMGGFSSEELSAVRTEEGEKCLERGVATFVQALFSLTLLWTYVGHEFMGERLLSPLQVMMVGKDALSYFYLQVLHGAKARRRRGVHLAC
jgi:hypothetical protein